MRTESNALQNARAGNLPQAPLIAVSNSELRSKNSCLRNWNLQSNNRLNLRPLRPDTKLWLGTGVHNTLDRFYIHKEPMLETFIAWSEAEIIRWCKTRTAVRSGRCHDDTIENRRLEFAQRQYQSGRMTDGEPTAETVAQMADRLDFASEGAKQRPPEHSGGGC